MKYTMTLLLMALGVICGLSPTDGFAAQHVASSSDLMFAQAIAGPPSDGGTERWHLVRTPGPDKSGDIVSVMHTADTPQSDADFAGMIVRCRPKGPLQIAFVLITPFPPRAHPRVTVSVNHDQVRFQGEAIPPGTMVALPGEAEVLAKGPWQSAATLAVDVEKDATPIHGVIQLDNLASAISYLRSNCSER